ncbi:PQ loop repeat-domain-containing protein [Vararia minispora EC-137]|uniref:PQ loop repeat-domain-containing protein n=1 Tax=Vararia minispora EC-137 TaxID=1314806 RepID=A0ACB8QZC5_9AGAM|nr:PQ loop repeat-domain-containing protein [Vararia minispora EC-137]
MPSNSVAENVFGTLGVLCWTVQLVPQIWKSYHSKSTKGLAPILVLFWGLAGIPLGIYNVVQNVNVPLIVQPQLFGFLCLLSWAQCQYYGNGRSLTWCVYVFVSLLAIFAALEVGIVYAIRPHYERGERSAEIGLRFISVFTSVMIGVALLPQYYEIYKHKAVIGISVIMITVDMMGGVFSDISLAFKPKFDPWIAVSYSLVAVMDSVVIIAAVILNPRARRRERRRQQVETEVVDSTRGTTVQSSTAFVIAGGHGGDPTIPSQATRMGGDNEKPPEYEPGPVLQV